MRLQTAVCPGPVSRQALEISQIVAAACQRVGSLPSSHRRSPGHPRLSGAMFRRSRPWAPSHPPHPPRRRLFQAWHWHWHLAESYRVIRVIRRGSCSCFPSVGAGGGLHGCAIWREVCVDDVVDRAAFGVDAVVFLPSVSASGLCSGHGMPLWRFRNALRVACRRDAPCTPPRRRSRNQRAPSRPISLRGWLPPSPFFGGVWCGVARLKIFRRKCLCSHSSKPEPSNLNLTTQVTAPSNQSSCYLPNSHPFL